MPLQDADTRLGPSAWGPQRLAQRMCDGLPTRQSWASQVLAKPTPSHTFQTPGHALLCCPLRVPILGQGALKR